MYRLTIKKQFVKAMLKVCLKGKVRSVTSNGMGNTAIKWTPQSIDAFS